MVSQQVGSHELKRVMWMLMVCIPCGSGSQIVLWVEDSQIVLWVEGSQIVLWVKGREGMLISKGWGEKSRQWELKLLEKY